jgi:hypothetical protein
MNKRSLLFSAVALALVLPGCAHLPDATVTYYLPRTEIRFKVIRTVACDAQNTLIVINSATPTVTNSADRSERFQIYLPDLKGWLSDADVKFDFFEDGRLRNINATSTGEGEPILKTIVSIALAAAVLASDGGKDYTKECALIKKFAGDKPLTITYEGRVDVTKAPTESQDIEPEDATAVYASQLVGAIGGVCAFVTGTEQANEPASYSPRDGDALLRARQPGIAKIRITTGTMERCKGTDIWNGQLPVAQIGKPYTLPMPKPVLFGKEAFGASFSESGALTSLQYTSNTGVGQALNVANAALTGVQNETAQKAAAVKAEADLIAQQQRLAQCLADRATCK